MRAASIAVVLASVALAPGAHAATLTVLPARAVAGGAVLVHAGGLPAGSVVRLRVGGESRRLLPRHRTVDAAFTLPARLPASVRVSLVAGRIRLGVRLRRASAPAAALTSVSTERSGVRALLSPTRADPGARVTLRLSGLSGRRRVTLGFGGKRIGSGRASTRGTAVLRARVPRRISARSLHVAAGRARLTIPFTVAPPAAPPAPPVPDLPRTAVVAAAGDIACPPGQATDPAFCRQAATADLVAGIAPDLVLALGDEQYESGTLDEFRGSYDPTWGRFKAITRPVPGNHEYGADPAAKGYFDYFGAAAGDRASGWYSFDLARWHVVALNSNCKRVGGCDESSRQYAWLRDDLAANPSPCTMAIWHHALFTSSFYPGEEAGFMRPIWQMLSGAGVDVALVGHAHSYERFAPMTADGTADAAAGIREFVVGSGGEDHRSIFGFPRRANMEAGADVDFGVLRMELRPDGYAWRFVPAGTTLFADSGRASCR